MRMSTQTKDAVCEMYREGKTGPEIARTLGTDSSSVYRVLKARGIARVHCGPRRFFDEAQSAEIVHRYLDGATASAIAELYACNEHTVRNVLRRMGVAIRPTGPAVRMLPTDAVDQIVARHESGCRVSTIAAAMGIGHDRVRRALELRGIVPCRDPLRGRRHPNWKGGRVRFGEYVAIRLQPGHPLFGMTKRRGYIFEHRLVMAEHLGRVLRDDETVHHINGNGADNRLENLQLRRGQHGTGESWRCRRCGSHDIEAVPLKEAP